MNVWIIAIHKWKRIRNSKILLFFRLETGNRMVKTSHASHTLSHTSKKKKFRSNKSKIISICHAHLLFLLLARFTASSFLCCRLNESLERKNKSSVEKKNMFSRQKNANASSSNQWMRSHIAYYVWAVYAWNIQATETFVGLPGKNNFLAISW